MMRASDHTAAMLSWWSAAHVDRADIAVRRRGGTMVVHANRALTDLPLAWARAANAQGGDVYLRPARGRSWPIVLLDDVGPELALRIAGKYAALVVYTSQPGGCQVWLRCALPLAEYERHEMQRWLAHRCGADPAATSGAQFGRAAGFKNCKRGGCWVNTVSANHSRPTWEPPIVAPKPWVQRPQRSSRAERDHSASAQEWGWICGLLEAGLPPDAVHQRLLAAAQARGRSQAVRYASHTIANALRRRSLAANPR